MKRFPFLLLLATASCCFGSDGLAADADELPPLEWIVALADARAEKWEALEKECGPVSSWEPTTHPRKRVADAMLTEAAASTFLLGKIFKTEEIALEFTEVYFRKSPKTKEDRALPHYSKMTDDDWNTIAFPSLKNSLLDFHELNETIRRLAAECIRLKAPDEALLRLFLCTRAIDRRLIP